ncbi:MAG: ABC transporter substrate-binding protein [Candidatus Thermoplasmatota archaeon]|jgi:predicted solute-binding protein|nr:ABC transporter substrate-binding protein [Candidatus Thermoplasmatota archaeon]
MYGIINFSHSDPLYNAIEDKGMFVRSTPGEILRGILAGELDGGMVSLVSCLSNSSLKLEKVVTISSKSTTLSTELVSSGKPLMPGMQISATAHTETTSFYLSLVLNALGITHTVVKSRETSANALLSASDYALVIGDEALSLYRSEYHILLDTGFEFSRIFSLPPVYAVTVSGKGKDCSSYLKELSNAASAASEFREGAAAALSEKTGISQEIVRSYYRNIRYRYEPVFDKTISVVVEHMNMTRTHRGSQKE